jgi:hypothetical protein
MTSRSFQILAVLSLLLVGCSSQFETIKNGDLEVRLKSKKGRPSLTIKNIGSENVAIGVRDTAVWNDTILEIQVGEYSYLQTFMTDFQVLSGGKAYTMTLDNFKSDKYLLKLIYTKMETNEYKNGAFRESTTVLYPNGKFFVLNIDGIKITQSTTSIY